MTYIDLINDLSQHMQKFSKQESFFDIIFELKDVNVDLKEINNFLSQKDEDFIDSTIQSLKMIVEACEQEDNITFIGTKFLETFKNNICSILQILEKIIKSNSASTQDSGETFKKSVDDKVQEMQDKFIAFDTRLNESNMLIDKHFDKVEADLNSAYSSLLVNNISILGIFVAIAFAGFFTTSIFSQIKIDFNEFFLVSVFSIILISFLVYNLLMVLFYFIYKINQINCVRKQTETTYASSDTSKNSDNNQTTNKPQTENDTASNKETEDKQSKTCVTTVTNDLLTTRFGQFISPFIKIDYILLAITIILFIACLVF